jgi:hypothetical protein
MASSADWVNQLFYVYIMNPRFIYISPKAYTWILMKWMYVWTQLLSETVYQTYFKKEYCSQDNQGTQRISSPYIFWREIFPRERFHELGKGIATLWSFLTSSTADYPLWSPEEVGAVSRQYPWLDPWTHSSYTSCVFFHFQVYSKTSN